MTLTTGWEPPVPTRIAWPRGVGDSGLTAIAEAVLAYLVNRDERVVTTTNREIAESCHMAVRTVNKALNELEDAGLITRTVDPMLGGPGNPGRSITVHAIDLTAGGEGR